MRQSGRVKGNLLKTVSYLKKIRHNLNTNKTKNAQLLFIYWYLLNVLAWESDVSAVEIGPGFRNVTFLFNAIL